MKIRSLRHLLTLGLFALLAARAGALTIVQTATVPLNTFLNPAVGEGFWDFDAFAPDDGGTLTAVSLKTSFYLDPKMPLTAIGSWSATFTLGSDLGFYSPSQSEILFGFNATPFVVTFNPPSFTPSQLANFLDPAQSQLRFGASVEGSDIFGNDSCTISGNGTFDLTYEYETASANVPEAGSTALLLGGALAGLWTVARRRAFFSLLKPGNIRENSPVAV